MHSDFLAIHYLSSLLRCSRILISHSLSCLLNPIPCCPRRLCWETRSAHHEYLPPLTPSELGLNSLYLYTKPKPRTTLVISGVSTPRTHHHARVAIRAPDESKHAPPPLTRTARHNTREKTQDRKSFLPYSSPQINILFSKEHKRKQRHPGVYVHLRRASNV